MLEEQKLKGKNDQQKTATERQQQKDNPKSFVFLEGLDKLILLGGTPFLGKDRSKSKASHPFPHSQSVACVCEKERVQEEESSLLCGKDSWRTDWTGIEALGNCFEKKMIYVQINIKLNIFSKELQALYS